MMSIRLMLAEQLTRSDGHSRRYIEAHKHMSELKQEETFAIIGQDLQLPPLLALPLGLAVPERPHFALA